MTEPAVRDPPPFHMYLIPVLRVLAQGDSHSARQVIEAVADRLGLDEGQRTQTIPSGQRRLDNRVTWALSYLYQARAVAKPGPGLFQVTERGRDLLAAHPETLTVEDLRQFEEFRSFQAIQDQARRGGWVGAHLPAHQLGRNGHSLRADQCSRGPARRFRGDRAGPATT